MSEGPYHAAYAATDALLGEALAENRKLARWLVAAWSRTECPECRRETNELGRQPHVPGCEFAAWLGSRDRRNDDAE